MRTQRLVRSVAVVTACSLFAGAAAYASSRATGLRAAGPQGDLLALIDDLDQSIAQLRDDQYLSDALDRAGAEPEESLARGKQLIADLSTEEARTLEDVLETTPGLQDIPEAIDRGVTAAAPFTPDGPAAGFGIVTGDAVSGAGGHRSNQAFGTVMAIQSATYTDDCPSAGDPKALIIATLVLNQLQSAAYAAVIAAPSVIGLLPGITAPAAIKQILAVIYGVALAVYLALAQTLAVASDCAAAAGSEDLALAWPVAGPNSVNPPPGSPVPGSSQISVDAALLSVGNVTAILNSVTTNLTIVTGQVATLGQQTADLNTTLSCTSGTPAATPTPTCGGPGQPPAASDVVSRTEDVQNDLQTVQANTDILRNTQHTVLDKANQEIEALARLEALQIRLEVEANLSDPAFQAVALYQLPAPWGYLAVVTAVVTETVANFGGGEADLQAANQAAAAGRYEDAYVLYHKAYQGAMK